MVYVWKDKNTGIVVEVDRKMSESNIAPDKPEALDAGMDVEDFAVAEWEKVITGGIGTIGFGMKGHW